MTDFLNGLPPKMVDYIKVMGDWAQDDVALVIKTANVAPAPTSAAWDYVVQFELQSASTGEVIPINGTVGAGAADTSTAGTASVSSATPAMELGRGSVTFSGDAADWLDTETATLTLTYTNLRGGTDTDTFVVTFTA